MPPRLEALTEVFYDNHVRKTGDQFDAVSDEDARKLVGWLKVKVVDAKPVETVPPVEEPPKLETRVLSAEENKQESEARRKRVYKRRDMRAEE